jgi:membrane protein DedA with SNARE-associated domain
LAAGAGAAIGELSCYYAGVTGHIFLQNSEREQKFQSLMQKNGTCTILVLAFIPNPLFDIAGIIAGSMRVPLWKFLLLCIVGKIGKMLLFSYLGAGIYSVTR